MSAAAVDGQAFLRALVVPELRRDEILWSTQFEVDPLKAGPMHWAGECLNGAPPQGPVNGYISLGAFRRGGRRRKCDQTRALAIALDDISTDDLQALPLEPTWILETSPHNNQVGYGLADGDKLEEVDRVLRMLSSKGFKLGPDKSGNNAVRYVRLPGCVNTKRAVIEEVGQPWPVQLTELDPDRRYAIAELAGAFATAGEDRAPDDPKEPDTELIARILAGEAFHGSFTRLAARWIAQGKPAAEVERELLELAERATRTVSDERRERLRQEMQEIPRYVREAVEKFSPGKGADIIDTAIAKLAEDVGAVFEPEVIEALKALRARSPAEYQRKRKRIKDAGGSVSELDRLVCAGGKGEEDTGQGRPFELRDPEPWPEPVDGAELLDELAATSRRYVVLPRHADTTLALWVMLTYAMDYVAVAPMLPVTSPEKRCGKTTVLDLLLRLTRRPLAAANISAASLFRAIDAWAPTLLIDEADTFIAGSDELRGVLNSGHTRPTAFVIRTVGDDHEPRQFSTWSAKAVALIGALSDTLADRSIEIRLARKLPSERVERLRHADPSIFEALARKCARWVADHTGAIRAARPETPEELHDRAADNWEPLLAIADLAGGEWPGRARKAAVALSGGEDIDTGGLRVQLLGDIRTVFEARDVDRISSENLTAALVEIEERPWSEYRRGKPLTKAQLARLLGRKSFGIVSTTVRFPDAPRAKGYHLSQFEEAFKRYLPPSRPPAETLRRDNVDGARVPGDFRNVTPEACHASENARKPSDGAGCHGVTDWKGGVKGVYTQKEAPGEPSTPPRCDPSSAPEIPALPRRSPVPTR